MSLSESLPRGRPSLAVLRRFVRREPREQCDFCSVPLSVEHAHALELASGQVRCCCDACAMLFDSPHGQKYRRIPRDARQLAGFQMTDAQWESLQIPIQLAFFVDSSVAGRVVARYPSPAGAIESLLTMSAWQELRTANPVLAELDRDVEALLVKRLGHEHRYFIAPIDQCYRLTGLIRMHWHGLSGGTEVWHEIEAFFRELADGPQARGPRHA